METFFKSILLANDSRENEFMEKNKSIEYEKRERLWEKTAYVSANGLDYIKLYRKTYDQYLKKNIVKSKSKDPIFSAVKE